jgi:hypothetical protein
MAKHSAPQSGAATGGTVVVIRPVALSAEDYLGRLRSAATTLVPTTIVVPGRHSRS